MGIIEFGPVSLVLRLPFPPSPLPSPFIVCMYWALCLVMTSLHQKKYSLLPHPPPKKKELKSSTLDGIVQYMYNTREFYSTEVH